MSPFCHCYSKIGTTLTERASLYNNIGIWLWDHIDQEYKQHSVETADIDVQGNGISIYNGDTSPDGIDGTDFGAVDSATGIIKFNFSS